MGEILMQSQNASMDKTGNVLLDIECLAQGGDKLCSGSPKMKKSLSRKGSCRMERRGAEDQDFDETTKRVVIKVVPSLPEQMMQPLLNINGISDAGEARNKRCSSRLAAIHPKKILLFFATMCIVVHACVLHLRFLAESGL